MLWSVKNRKRRRDFVFLFSIFFFFVLFGCFFLWIFLVCHCVGLKLRDRKNSCLKTKANMCLERSILFNIIGKWFFGLSGTFVGDKCKTLFHCLQRGKKTLKKSVSSFDGGENLKFYLFFFFPFWIMDWLLKEEESTLHQRRIRKVLQIVCVANFWCNPSMFNAGWSFAEFWIYRLRHMPASFIRVKMTINVHATSCHCKKTQSKQSIKQIIKYLN